MSFYCGCGFLTNLVDCQFVCAYAILFMQIVAKFWMILVPLFFFSFYFFTRYLVNVLLRCKFSLCEDQI